MIERPGVYQVDAAAYHADNICPTPSLSSSGARRLVQACPAIYWHERNHPRAPSEALRVGSAAHEWLLEGETWPRRHFVLPEDHDGRTKDGKARVAEAVGAGLRVITADQFATIQAMHAALEAHPFVMRAFQHGHAEQSLYWRDEEFGIWCRARLDFVPNGAALVTDYKTSDGVHPDHLRATIHKYGYAQQSDWYLDGIHALDLLDDPVFLFVFQDKNPPHLIVPVTLTPAALGWGRIQNRKARSLFARCLRSGEWPGYANDVIELDLPPWAEAQLQREHEAGAYEPEAIAA